jgi:hypothetical protein
MTVFNKIEREKETESKKETREKKKRECMEIFTERECMEIFTARESKRVRFTCTRSSQPARYGCGVD